MRTVLGIICGVTAGLAFEGLLLYGCYKLHIALVPIMLVAQGLMVVFNYRAHKGE